MTEQTVAEYEHRVGWALEHDRRPVTSRGGPSSRAVPPRSVAHTDADLEAMLVDARAVPGAAALEVELGTRVSPMSECPLEASPRSARQRYPTPPPSFARSRPTTASTPTINQPLIARAANNTPPRRTHQRPADPCSDHAAEDQDGDPERRSQPKPGEPTGVDEGR